MFYFNPELAAGDGIFLLFLFHLLYILQFSYIYKKFIFKLFLPLFYIYFLGIDDGDEAISSYVREEDEAEEKVEYRELDMDRLALEASEIDTSGITVAGADRLKNNKDINNQSSTGI